MTTTSGRTCAPRKAAQPAPPACTARCSTRVPALAVALIVQLLFFVFALLASACRAFIVQCSTLLCPPTNDDYCCPMGTTCVYVNSTSSYVCQNTYKRRLLLPHGHYLRTALAAYSRSSTDLQTFLGVLEEAAATDIKVAELVGLLRSDQFNNTLLAPDNAALDAALGALGMTPWHSGCWTTPSTPVTSSRTSCTTTRWRARWERRTS